jgi:hypothetical protein
MAISHSSSRRYCPILPPSFSSPALADSISPMMESSASSDISGL